MGKVMQAEYDIVDDGLNPLDKVEEILTASNWMFNRVTQNELIVKISGKDCEYRLFFVWQDEMPALQFYCQFDLKIPQKNIHAAQQLILDANLQLGLGHFDLPLDTKTPGFRYTILIQNPGPESHEFDLIEDIIDISLAQCEHHYQLFALLSKQNTLKEKELSLALLVPRGEA